MWGAPIIEQLPMAALVGVMFMVAIGTFEWASLKVFGKMPLTDVIVMVIVTLITVFLHNLALAVLIGVIISALAYAWENAKRIRARKYTDENGSKHYEIYGPLFFGSITVFIEKFDVQNDPDDVHDECNRPARRFGFANLATKRCNYTAGESETHQTERNAYDREA